MGERKLPLWALAGLGATQIIGYGTLYYAFSILVPDIAHDIGRSQQWVFGAFSAGPSGRQPRRPAVGLSCRRIGAGRLMAAGSIRACAALVPTACRRRAISFAIALALTEIVSVAVLYATAFTAIVQAGRPEGPDVDRSPDPDRWFRLVSVLAADVLAARFSFLEGGLSVYSRVEPLSAFQCTWRLPG